MGMGTLTVQVTHLINNQDLSNSVGEDGFGVRFRLA